eukprot:6678303-Prymnesium_polylepis.1
MAGRDAMGRAINEVIAGAQPTLQGRWVRVVHKLTRTQRLFGEGPSGAWDGTKRVSGGCPE